MQTTIAESRKLLAKVTSVLHQVFKTNAPLKKRVMNEYRSNPYTLRTRGGFIPSVLLAFWPMVNGGIVIFFSNRKVKVGVAKSPVQEGFEFIEPTLWEEKGRLPETINTALRIFSTKKEMLKQLNIHWGDPYIKTKGVP